jgi:hypothetical protein
MKKLIFLIFIILKANFLCAQEFVFPMYFEDALGNRDTVYIGYDANGNRDVILPEFGEVDIAHIPFDSVFDVRITNQSDIHEGRNVAGLFHTKRKIILSPEPFYYWPQVNLDIQALHWPVKASWDPALFDNPTHEGTLFSSVHPMGWWDVIGYPLWWGNSNFDKSILIENQEITFTPNYPENWQDYPNGESLVFYTDDHDRPIATYFVVFGDSTLITVGVSELHASNKIKLSPNPATTHAWLQLPEKMLLAKAQIELYSPTGRLLYKAQPTSQFHKIEVAHLPKGLYLVRVWDGEKWLVEKLVVR